MSYVNATLHAVWATKNHFPYFTSENRIKIIRHILENAKKKKIYIPIINLAKDHLHCLVRLNADESISKTIQLIKGECAFWINKQGLFNSKFEWANEYYAAAVIDAIIPDVKKYIENQEEHHKKITFMEEVEKLLGK